MKVLDEEVHRRWRNSKLSSITAKSIMNSATSEVGSVLPFGRRGSSTMPAMQIKLKNHYNSKVYNSRSPVSGNVVIAPPYDIPFQTVSIVLVGHTKTKMEVAQMVQTASHTFLKLEMPIPQSAYPSSKVFQGGNVYNIPFEFVIPEHLTMSACRHNNQTEDVADQHFRPPPSMGTWEKDDLSPVMSRVEYTVLAVVTGEPEFGLKPLVLMETAHRINVLPVSIEDPPLNVTIKDKGYSLEKSANIRKHIFAGKKGRVTASVAQPAPIRVKADGTMASPVNLDVNLSFDPTSSNGVAPELNQVTAKLQATTWFSRVPMGNLPNIGVNQLAITGIAHMSYSTSLPLGTVELKKNGWKRQNSQTGSLTSLAIPEANTRRQSETAVQPTQSSATDFLRRRSESCVSAALKSSLQLSLQVPTQGRLLLPTFHACLISRTYSIQLSLNVGDSKVNLVIPVQVVIESPHQHTVQSSSLPTFDDVLAAQEEADADELLRPRVIVPLAEEFRGNSVLPGYQ